MQTRCLFCDLPPPREQSPVFPLFSVIFSTSSFFSFFLLLIFKSQVLKTEPLFLLRAQCLQQSCAAVNPLVLNEVQLL